MRCPVLGFANWVRDFEADSAPSAIKAGAPLPFLEIPGFMGAKSMEPDYRHAFHLGCGIDAAASTIVMLAKLNHFGPGSFNNRLQTAYGRFIAWLPNKRSTSIKELSKLQFDMQTKFVRRHIQQQSKHHIPQEIPQNKHLCWSECLGTLHFPYHWVGKPMTLPLSWPGLSTRCNSHQLLATNTVGL